MITLSGTGDTTGHSLYTSALEAGAMTPVIRLSAASHGATIVDLNMNGTRLQRAGNGNAAILVPADVQPSDSFTFDISNSTGGSWTVEFLLYPAGDVAR